MAFQVPDWLNVEFIEKVLKNSENDESIKVTGLAAEPVVGNGDNYGSVMIRQKVEYSCIKSGLKTMEKKSLIVKISPMVDSAQKEILQKMDAFNTEIKMMTTTLRKMTELLKEDDYRLYPHVLYTKIGDPSLLVMEDLAVLKFRMSDKQAGLNMDHCIIVMERLAKFHASSVALCEKDPKAMKTYNYGVFNNDYPQSQRDLFAGGIKSLANQVDKWSELGPSSHSYSEKLLKLADVCFERATKSSKPKDDEFNVINHGDCWINNQLFRYNEDGKVIDHIFVDFQLSFWSSPAIDILPFLATSTSEEVEIYHRDALLEKYLATLTSTMSRLGCKTKPPNMAELEKSLKEREFYGMLIACMWLPFMLAEKSEASNLDEILCHSKSDERKLLYCGLAYRKIMVRRLPEWNARGLLDV